MKTEVLNNIAGELIRNKSKERSTTEQALGNDLHLSHLSDERIIEGATAAIADMEEVLLTYVKAIERATPERKKKLIEKAYLIKDSITWQREIIARYQAHGPAIQLLNQAHQVAKKLNWPLHKMGVIQHFDLNNPDPGLKLRGWVCDWSNQYRMHPIFLNGRRVI